MKKNTSPASLDFDPQKNYEKTLEEIGYVTRKKATKADYERIGFMSGLEVHQQLKTKEKLFCHCPAGIYHSNDNFDAEVIRHMRPTLSELGEYDGTALMEYKTKKEIIYRINNKTACTYEIDDTPPFKIDREALEYALEISLLCKLNIVGEVHITRKQYLDGSIPTGFQRTAILGVEGEIPLKNKTVRLIQLDALKKEGCGKIYQDIVSGMKKNRPGLDEALSHLRKGDTLVVWKLDRLGRSLKGLLDLIEKFYQREIQFKSLTDGINTTTSVGRFFFNIMGSLAQMERELMIERTLGRSQGSKRTRSGGGQKESPGEFQTRCRA